jgi:hypothetical protein
LVGFERMGIHGFERKDESDDVADEIEVCPLNMATKLTTLFRTRPCILFLCLQHVLWMHSPQRSALSVINQWSCPLMSHPIQGKGRIRYGGI